MTIQKYLDEKRTLVDQFLETTFLSHQIPGRLREAVRYSLLAGGKRIRPILTLASAEACGWGEEGHELALPVGSTLEMIHCYSLIHDDLPAMDDDDLRRGQPTNHKKFDEATAILAGDALLTESFSILSSLKTKNPTTLLRVIQEIARASGGEGMAGGQALDLESEGKGINAQELETIHRMKTGCLIRASVLSGGLVAAASEEKLQALKVYGEAIGLTFQIADDILNVEGTTEGLGKSAGNDAAHQKATYASILGLEKSKRLAREWTEKAIQALSVFDRRADPLRDLARFVIERKA